MVILAIDVIFILDYQGCGSILCKSGSTFIWYGNTDSRDHKGVGVAHKITSPKKPASIFSDNDEVVLVR